MKKKLIMLVMAGMLIVPMGNVCAEGEPAEASIGYVFPKVESMVVLGVDALSGRVLSSDEIVGYSYVPWVVVDAETFNLPVGFNLLDYFEYGCDGLSKEDLDIKILVAQVYQEEGSTEFVEGLYTDVTSDPIIRGEGTYSYKIIVTKPGDPDLISKVEAGYFGVSPLAGSLDGLKTSASLATAESIESPSDPSELFSNISDDYKLSIDTSSVVTGSEIETMTTDAVDRTYNVTYTEWKELHPGWEGSPEFNVGCYKIFKEWLAEHPDRTEEEHSVALNVFMDSWVEEYADDFTKDDLYKRDIFARDLARDFYEVWRVQGAIDSSKYQEIVDIINVKRAETSARYSVPKRIFPSAPLILDQTLVKSALIRAAECSAYYDQQLNMPRPGGKYKDPLVWSGSEQVAFLATGRSPEEVADKLFRGTFFFAVANYDEIKYVGIGQYGGVWVAIAAEESSKIKPVPVTDEFLASLTSSSRETDVIADPTIAFVKFEPDYFSTKTIDMSQTFQCQAYLKASVPSHDYPNKVRVNPSTLTWTSSNPKIAFVDSNGLATGLMTGSATITGTANNKSITYTINVSANGTPTYPDLTDYLVKYRTHVQNVGWQGYVADSATSGTSGRSLRLEGINIALDPSIDGGIEYKTHVQNIGWQDFVSNGAMSGTEGKSYRLEGIEMRLTGAASDKYDIYYRTHTQNIGWMGWAKNGESSGSAGLGYRLEGIEVQLVLKDGPAPGSTDGAFVQK